MRQNGRKSHEDVPGTVSNIETLISVVHRGVGDGEFDPLPGGLTTVSTLGFFNVLISEIMEPVIQLPYTALMSNMVSDQM